MERKEIIERIESRMRIIAEARSHANESLATIENELSHLPNLVTLVAPSDIDGNVWHERISMLEKTVMTGKQSWYSAEHYLQGTMKQLERMLNDASR